MKREVFFIIFNPVNYLMLAHEKRWSGSLGQETGIYKWETALVFMPQPVSVALC
jgi:hypothetical protein